MTQPVVWIMRACVAVILLIVAYETLAHHDVEHREFYIGEFAELPATITVCDENQARAMLEGAKESQGIGYNQAVMGGLMAGVCEEGQAYVRIDEVLEEYTDPGGVNLKLVRVTIRADVGQPESPPFFTTVVNIEVSPPEAKKDVRFRCVGECQPA